MEVGWYLRLSKAREVVALVREDVLPALEDQAAMNPGWTMSVRRQEEYACVTFARKSAA